MYSLIFQTHIVTVISFLLLYLVKTTLLVINKNELLASITKFTRIPEMILSFAFLISGIYLAINNPMLGTLFYIKVACVFASIPLAVIGFKRKNKLLAVLALGLIIAAYGLAEMNKGALKRAFKKQPIVEGSLSDLDLGKAVYARGCQMCHGPSGDAGVAGAFNLKTSHLSETETMQVLKKGRNSMPSFSYFSDKELNSVVKYINTFKTP